MPGRCVDVGAGGIAAVLAGELSPGESVGVEMHLPLAAIPFRARALVRHHNKLRCGMEFVGLSDDQQAAIRNSTEKPRTKKERPPNTQPKLPPEGKNTSTVSPGDSDSGGQKPLPNKQRGREWLILLFSALVLLAVLWWRWNRGWEDLESDLRKNDTILRPEANVPADVMEKLVTHRVDPDYPVAARQNNLRGVVVLDVIVGRDGSVASVHPLNGPDVLAQSAMDALRWWRFEPYRVNGQAEVVETTVAVEFKP
jgi:TonB family protein